MNELNNLEDHIDEPIKKCVVGMALLGFKPVMSCCGFNYKGEKVPKKHLEKAYMYLDYPSLIERKLGSDLLTIGTESGWNIGTFRGKTFIDFYAPTWENKHPWNDFNCPHFHEKFVIAIASLEESIINLKKHFKEKVVIEDGNTFYKEKVSKYWQYEPTQDWEVTPETFDKL